MNNIVAGLGVSYATVLLEISYLLAFVVLFY